MRRTTSPDQNPHEWTQLGEKQLWEHTQWLTRKAANEVFENSFVEWDSSHYKDLPGIPAEQRSKELLHRKAPFIALVNSKCEFQRLLDRQKLMALVVEVMVEG